ncbi:MAG: ABC transporter permease [Hyphomonadaceae bacterium]
MKDSSKIAERVLILEKGRAERNYWSDLWAYRELFAILVWRDIAVQYKQAAFGVAWAIVRPLLTMLIFTVIFGHIAKLPSTGAAPYPIMVMTGVLAWSLISTILSQGSNSLVANANLISKVYFPRVIVPVATGGVAFVDFAISLALLFAMMIGYGFTPDWHIVAFPFFAVLAALAGLGPALLFASLNVRFRDFRFLVPFVVQFGMYASPVGFTTNLVPPEWRLLYALNPAVGPIVGFRWSLLHGEAPLSWDLMLLNGAVIASFLIVGLFVFRASERTLADVI